MGKRGRSMPQATERNLSELPAPAPGGASTRKEAQRFRYAQAVDTAFIELDHRMTRETFVQLLSEVPGVQSVSDKPKSKLEEEGVDYGCTGHYMQRNVLVVSKF